MSKVYVIIQDDDKNFHQGAINEVNQILISNMVGVYPQHAFTKDLLEVIETLNENYKMTKK